MKSRILLMAAMATSAVLGGERDLQPDALLKERLGTPMLKLEGTRTGEGVCWHAAYGMDGFVAGYRRTKDPAWLAAGVTYYEAVLAKLHEAPDGYKGWVGPFIYDKKVTCDVHIGDAILVNPLLEFSELILKSGNEALKAKYEGAARAYLDLARKHLIEKWDRRGTWREDGPLGGYVSWDRYLSDDGKTWELKGAAKSANSLPFNKQNEMALACLRIYRITGEEPYRAKALRIFNFMKARMCLFDGHYVWNYWEPLGPWDVDRAAPHALVHWVNVHPYRNYQAGEVRQLVEAYHSGLTFARADLERILNTNLKVMWNGDREKPLWRNSNRAVYAAAYGHEPDPKPPGGDFKQLAGCLWTPLADFDATIRELGGIAQSAPPSFERQHPELPVSELAVPVSNSRFLAMAAALPMSLDKGQQTTLVSKSRLAAELEIDLYSEDGAKRLAEIRHGPTTGGEDGRAGILVVDWTPRDLAPGRYRVRWTIQGEYREYPLELK
ncbi:MAG: hypothetical protein M5U26_16460 [Planctomycetota bacterium]|nr:hypothetical protein [Planctomycetota bacterium]